MYVAQVLIALDRSIRGISCAYHEAETFVQPGGSVLGPVLSVRINDACTSVPLHITHLI